MGALSQATTVPKGFPHQTKVALLIEDRPLSVLAPLLLHLTTVMAPDWRFLFLGSERSVGKMNCSAAIRHRVGQGKIELRRLPSDVKVAGEEMISRLLTSSWLYHGHGIGSRAEWLLLFQTDSMICANSMVEVDDFLRFDWVGAPWNPEGEWGGNGGLSLRRVEPIRAILRSQHRVANSDPEDVWLSERLLHAPGSRMANGSVSLAFSGEMNAGQGQGRLAVPTLVNGTMVNPAGHLVEGIDDWRRGFYEPMGYHIGGGGVWLHAPIWGTPELRNHVWKYCPEVKMVLPMDIARFVPGECAARWP
ncbi:hypothetical protein XA68_18399 [Ophiocordyceps unilateralis]|uniref:DUF5672 domain-containing protein n=1 Tax=Ophiocordyceps unilateralis TaxID=268505 RepID=A0A2A9PIJ4_OPHUN|nr:hypothetical protein XA68_18399 [Ophiocordyceps unilateralis]